MPDQPLAPLTEGGFHSYVDQNSYFCGLVTGYSMATGTPLSTMTGHGDWFIIRDDTGAQSATILRTLTTAQQVYYAVQAQLDAMPFWRITRTIGDLPDDAILKRSDERDV